MLVQGFTEMIDAGDNGGGNITVPKIQTHEFDGFIPEGVANPLVQRAVTDDRIAAGFRRDEEQRRVAMFVRMQTGMLEFSLGALVGINIRIGNDPHADACARTPLGSSDRTLYASALTLIHGVKFTCGTFCAPGCASKYCFSANLDPNMPAIMTVGMVSRLVLNDRARSL